MKSLTLLLSVISCCFVSSNAYRDGAREESCYNHSVVHTNAFVGVCGAECHYFLNVKEVVNETTLELGNETTTYECGKVYGIEVDNDLNDPEGFLVQARDGTEDSSEIIGTFLDPTVVQQRNPTTPVNYKILRCRSSSTSSGELLDNSATHPNTVNDAGILQLYWQAPDCTNGSLPNVTLWFTIVQQLTVVFSPSKSTVLTYRAPPPPPTTTSAPIITTPMNMSAPKGPGDEQQSAMPLPTWGIIVIAVGGAAIILVIVVLVIVSVCCCCDPRKRSETYREDGSTNKNGLSASSPVYNQGLAMDTHKEPMDFEYTSTTFQS